jgi:hypothetical protein
MRQRHRVVGGKTIGQFDLWPGERTNFRQELIQLAAVKPEAPGMVASVFDAIVKVCDPHGATNPETGHVVILQSLSDGLTNVDLGLLEHNS